ncbi:MAG TPA: methyl-accepting chemotaxis protein [Pseudobdellovibrionaceae bacterium]
MKSFGLKTKILLSTIPLLIATILVGLKIYQLGVVADPEIARALEISRIINQQEIEMVKMSDYLRGYILNPKDRRSYELKKEADERYAALSKELEPLVAEGPEISEINKKMANYDAIVLDEKEIQVALLVEKGDPGVQAYFANEYIPTRKVQEENFAKLKSSAEEFSKKLVHEVERRKANSSYTTLTILAGSFAIGFVIIFLVLNSTVGIFMKSMKTLENTSLQMESTIINLNSQGQSLSGNSNSVASSLEETVASLEEMASMIKMNSENAQQAADLSNKAQEVAVRGETEIKGLVQFMDEISHSSKKIEEIIGVIDDIAFQTNLLALNAAVEAARAGEQGKGFAVVADAVRTLAQKSSDAAKGISQLIKDSVDKMEKGAEVATESGTVLTEIVQSIKKVSLLNDEISTASKEQSQGVTQLTQAMNQIDQSVQSNASATGEITSISEEVNAHSSSLKVVVGELNHLIRASA